MALTTMMNDNEDLISRLRAIGRRPVAPGVAARHLAAMGGSAEVGASRPRRHRARIVAAFAVGLMVGTTGLATAGALPNGAQEVAHRTLGSVGVSVPHGDRYQGPECGGTVKNHGQYVRSQPKGSRAAAAASRCGKPLKAGAGGGEDESDAGNGKGSGAGAECQGPPPWAGNGKPDQAAKDARKQACGDKQDGDEKDGKDPKAGGEKEAPAPAPAPAPEAVKGAEPETTSTSTTTWTATTATTTTSTTAAEGETKSTTVAPVPVPGLGS